MLKVILVKISLTLYRTKVPLVIIKSFTIIATEKFLLHC